MNLFNVSSAQTPKPVTVGSVSSPSSEMVTVSEGVFLEQYQQAIDETPPLAVVGGQSASTDDVTVTRTEIMNNGSDIQTSVTNIPDVIDTNTDTETAPVDSIIVDTTTDVVTDESLMCANDVMIAIDDAEELMAAGNVFLQQLTQSNQQLNSTNKTEVNSVDASGKSLPSVVMPTTDAVLTQDELVAAQIAIKTTDGSAAFIMPATAAAVTTTAASLTTTMPDNIDGQKSGANSDAELISDGSVNNLPLLADNGSLSATTSSTDMLINPAVFDGASLSTDDHRRYQSINSNTQEDSLAQQLVGLAPTSTTASTPPMLKPEQPTTTNSLQSPLVLTREQAGEEVHERINMMMAKNLKYVDIRLDPPELGKLQIKLSINQDQASVQFTVNNHQARDIVEQAMPRLREMLQQQGLQLAQSSVQQDSSQQFTGHQSNSSAHSQSGQQSSARSMADDGLLIAESNQPDSSISMYVKENKDQVDYYA
jgi:flagellar hook-length control protein FliK